MQKLTIALLGFGLYFFAPTAHAGLLIDCNIDCNNILPIENVSTTVVVETVISKPLEATVEATVDEKIIAILKEHVINKKFGLQDIPGLLQTLKCALLKIVPEKKHPGLYKAIFQIDPKNFIKAQEYLKNLLIFMPADWTSTQMLYGELKKRNIKC